MIWWARAHLDYLSGRLWLAGVDPASLSPGAWLDVAYAALVDLADGSVDRQQVMDAINEQLASSVFADRESWGSTPAAVAGARAMMDLAGGPAPLRDPQAHVDEGDGAAG